MRQLLLIVFASLALSGCETAYYNAWEKLGYEKRDLLVGNIEDTQEAQEDAQEQFKDALEQFRSVVNFDGGDLAKVYDKLSGEYEDSVAAADEIKENINSVEDVAEDLFAEWEEEIQQYSSAALKRDSQKKLRATRSQYSKLIRSMRASEKTMEPVLATLKDQVLYLKHNLNARAIASLKGELATVNKDVDKLIAAMQRSISESKAFVAQMKE